MYKFQNTETMKYQSDLRTELTSVLPTEGCFIVLAIKGSNDHLLVLQYAYSPKKVLGTGRHNRSGILKGNHVILRRKKDSASPEFALGRVVEAREQPLTAVIDGVITETAVVDHRLMPKTWCILHWQKRFKINNSSNEWIVDGSQHQGQRDSCICMRQLNLPACMKHGLVE